MRGTSARSFEDVLTRSQAGFTAPGAQPETLSGELFAIADLIDTSNRAVRLLSDPGRPVEVKQAAVRILLAGKVSPSALEATLAVVGSRWSAQEDILLALEQLGVAALFAQADAEGVTEQVEEELFQVAALIEESPQLSAAFDDSRQDPSARADVLRTLLEGRVHRLTSALAARAVGREDEEKPAQRVRSFAEFASQRRHRLLAVVETPKALSEQQQTRLRGILQGIYGREPQLHVEVVPEVVGGLRIQVGDELFDATVLARLAQARSHLVS